MAKQKSDIRLIQLANYIKPEIKEMTGRKWVLNGANNTFFKYVIDRYNGSPTNSAIIDGYADLMYGRGLADLDNPKEPLDPAILKILPKKEVKKIISDWALFTASVIEVTKTNGKVKEIRHIPTEMIAPSVIDDDEKINSYWYSWDWEKQWKYKPEEFPAWEKGAKDDVSLMVIRPYKAGKKYYSDPSYLSGLQYAEMEEEMSNYSINHIKGGMSFGYIVNFNNGSTLTPTQRDEMEKKITEKLTGTPNAGRFIISFNNGKEAEVTIVAFEQSDAHSQWDWLSKEAESKIIRAHRVTNPILVGIKENVGLGNNADEMDVAEHQLMKRVIAPKQEYLLDAFKEILEEAGIPKNLFFLPLTEIDEEGDSVDSDDEKLEGGKNEKVGKDGKEIDDTKADDKKKVELSVIHNTLISKGEAIDDEWALISAEKVNYDTCDQQDELLSLGVIPASPDAKDKQDKGLFKVRYRYSPQKLSTNEKGEIISRGFCREMVEANLLYRKEDIINANSLELNPGWGEYGTEPYSLWLHKGGGDCHHYWQREVYFRKRNKDGTFKQNKGIENDKKVGNKFMDEIGFVPIKNPKEVAERPTDRVKRGFLHKFSEQIKIFLAGFNPNQPRSKDGKWGNEITVYRGKGRNYRKGENEGFLWVATDKSDAMNYADLDENGEWMIDEFTIEKPKNVFTFPYKNRNQYVTSENIGNIFRQYVHRQVKAKLMNKSEWQIIWRKIDEFERLAGDKVEMIHTLINKPETSKLASSIIRDLGFDAIGVKENESFTYGLLKK